MLDDPFRPRVYLPRGLDKIFDQWLAENGTERSGTPGAGGTSYGLPQSTDVKATIQSFQEYLTLRPPPTR